MAVNSRALVIGINDYAFSPLTSAVEDARSFAAEIEKLGLVAKSDITLLTSPGIGATFDQIANALAPIYQSGNGIQRFFFSSRATVCSRTRTGRTTDPARPCRLAT